MNEKQFDFKQKMPLSMAHLERISIVGTSASGKSTLAHSVAAVLGRDTIDLDNFYFLPEWQTRSDEDFRSVVAPHLDSDQWIISGQYSQVRELIWSRASLIIWLDLPLRVLLKRIILRCIQRAWSRQSICNGNYESFYLSFCSRESMILWVLKTFHRRRKEYPAKLRHQQQTTNVSVLRFQSQQQVDSFLKSLARTC